VLRDGTATFSNLSFNVPGAGAEMNGTYNVLNEKIDLHGTLQTESELSKTTRGTKAFLLKILNPLFKKKPKGSIAPVKITGSYSHPSYALDLGNKHPHPSS
jgi:AsmA-like C-terminal region